LNSKIVCGIIGATEVRMDAAELKESLENLLRKWERRNYAEEHEWYNDCSSINEFIEDLEDIIERIKNEVI
jgi:hypothetical protein